MALDPKALHPRRWIPLPGSAGVLPFGAILAGLMTPLPASSSGASGGSSRLRPLFAALTACGSAVALLGRLLGCAGGAVLSLLDCLCRGRFQEILATFVQAAMAVAALLQVHARQTSA